MARGAAVTDLSARTVSSREASESDSRSSRLRTVAGGCVAVTTWTVGPLCAFTQVSVAQRSVAPSKPRSVNSSSHLCPGVVLQRVPNPTEPPPPKLTRSDLPSDDEVEVVTEWLAPPVLEGRRNVLETPPPMSPPTSPLLHVPVIQRPSDSGSSTTDQEEVC